MNKLKKRILILGSNALIAGIVERAKEMGLYTIVTDYNPIEKAPAKQIADEFLDVSLSDIDELEKIVYEKKVDGIITGYSDSYLEYYYMLCQRTKLPCYGSKKSFMNATDKGAFKKMCTSNYVSTIPGVCVESLDEAEMFIRKNKYPFIFKPADNSGSRGVVKCERKENMESAFEYAMSFSNVGKVICEKYMDMDNISVSYSMCNGVVTLSSTADRYVYNAKTGSSITSGLVYPSKYMSRYIGELNDTMKLMMKDNEFYNGVASYQFFVDNHQFYACEMCYRPSGGQHFRIVKDKTNVDEMEQLIRYAVSEQVCIREEDDYDWENQFYGMINIIGEENQKIAEYEIIDIDSCEENIIYSMKKLNIGDTIGRDGTTSQIIATVWFKARTYEHLMELAINIRDMYRVKNEAGKNLVLNLEFGKNTEIRYDKIC